MPNDSVQLPGPRHFFTAPWDPIVVRRGDALGMRAFADQISEAVAPGLSNRVRDGRWVTILAWCLVQSQKVFQASNGSAVSTRVQQRERYGWLRPLELMWIARTIVIAENDFRRRQLAGRRRVEPWLKGENRTTPRFGMSKDQFRAYRQTGMYGAYRVVFRKLPGLTEQSNGWIPAAATIKLANWLDRELGKALRPKIPQRVKSASRGKQDEWWLQNWKTFDQGNMDRGDNSATR